MTSTLQDSADSAAECQHGDPESGADLLLDSCRNPRPAAGQPEASRPATRLSADRENTLQEIGAVLRHAREQRALSLVFVAERLNIFERHLASLERGELPGVALTFARGYLKNYAEHLELDAELLVAGFNQFLHAQRQAEQAAEQQADEERVQNNPSLLANCVAQLTAGLDQVVALANRRGSSWSNGGFRSPVNVLQAATSAALPLLMLCVVAFAYYSIDADRLESEEVAIASLRAESEQPDKLGPLASEAVASNTTTSAAASQAPAAEPAPVALPIELANEPPAQAAAIVAADTTSQTRAAGVITVGEAGQVADRQTVPGPSLADAFEPVGPGAVEMIAQVQQSDRLVITVYEDSWIDVRDNSGARLYRNLAKAGRRIDVSGELPFALHVGNVPGLEMRLNGEPVEITRYRSDNSARLTLASN